MKIITIVVSYNGEKYIKHCLDSLLDSSISTEIIVVDNASDDKTKDIIKSEYSTVHLIENEHNVGFGAANNQGLRIALDQKPDYIFLLNQDAYIKSDTLSTLIPYAEINKKIGILSPIHIDPMTGEPERNFSNFTGIKNDNDTKRLYENGSGLYFYDFVNAAVWLLPIHCVESVGGFNPSFFHYGEDSNYAARVKYHGLLCAVVIDSIGYHSTSQRTKNHFNSDILYIYQKELIKKISDPQTHFFIVSEIMKRVFQIMYCLITFDKNKAVFYLDLLKILIDLDFKNIKKNRNISMKKGTSFLN